MTAKPPPKRIRSVSMGLDTKILSDNLIKPDTDKRSYRLLELSNEMRILLISDPEIKASSPLDADSSEDDDMQDEGEDGEDEGEEEEDEDEDESSDDEGPEENDKKPGDVGKKASCAVCVGVGYMSDPTKPRSIQGLAHFVEHSKLHHFATTCLQPYLVRVW